jgi:hypothetical protein
MMKKRVEIFRGMVVCVCAAMALTALGCSALNSKNSASPSASAATSEKSSVTASPAPTAAKESLPVYHDFGDVMLPRELTLDKKDSFVMKTAGMTSGVLVLKGSLDINSLVNFFENKMPVDGWQKMGSFRSARSIMLFEKPNRWCVIGISEGSFSTKVEVWVAPMESDGVSGRQR